MDRSEVRKLMHKLLQAKFAGDAAEQKAAREELARATAALAPEIGVRARARTSAAMASTVNDTT
jgi:hypothetical protein